MTDEEPWELEEAEPDTIGGSDPWGQNLLYGLLLALIVLGIAAIFFT